jgi:acetyl-CoA carboxylase biotin carboxyl carrier protein
MNDKNKRPAEDAVSVEGGKIDFEEIRKVIALLEEKNLSAFELEIEGFKIKLARNVAAPAAAPAPAVPAGGGVPLASEAITPGQAPPAEVDASLVYINSPMVGTFYRAPDPTAPPFVDVGDTVRKGQTLCIVEAMKLMNEIECDLDGAVVEILVENAKPVEFGQKLFAIKPAS